MLWYVLINSLLLDKKMNTTPELDTRFITSFYNNYFISCGDLDSERKLRDDPQIDENVIVHLF